MAIRMPPRRAADPDDQPMSPEEFARVVRKVVEATPTASLPDVVGALEAGKTAIHVRLNAATREDGGPTRTAEPAGPERWISAAEAAAIAGKCRNAIYSWAVGARWASRPTRRSLLINEAGFRRWLERQ